MACAPALQPPDLSPTALSYIAALRGIKPRSPEQAFTYAHIGLSSPHDLICLAASNPEGRFFGVLDNVGEVIKAEAIARARRVPNISFLGELAFMQLTTVKGSPSLLPKLDYCVVEQGSQTNASANRDAALEIVCPLLNQGALLAYSYCAYAQDNGPLRFIIQEFSAEMNESQANEFLQELKALGELYFYAHEKELSALNLALERKSPDAFFNLFSGDMPATSGTLETMVKLIPQGFALAGSSVVAANYMELATPLGSHEILAKCQDHVLYEPLKDLAANRLVRHDLWVKMPTPQSSSPAELFGGFTYGLVTLNERVPDMLARVNNILDIKLRPVMMAMLEVMKTLPMGLGDFLAHPNGKGISADDATTAMHRLIAAGLARPMRKRFVSKGKLEATSDQLKWANSFNRYLDDLPITMPKVVLASDIVGNGVTIPAREALVMQAINRAGLANSVDTLLLELMRIAQNPALACQIMDTVDPDEESARNMVQDVVQNSLVHWHSYGLLAA